MTEEVKIAITTEVDTKDLETLRTQLNEARNGINALARETKKGSDEWKAYKESVKEVNRVRKLSDQDLKGYIRTIQQEEQALRKVETAGQKLKSGKTQLTSSTDKLGKSFVSLKTNVGQYSNTLVHLTDNVAKGNATIGDSIGQLALYAGGWASVGAGIIYVTSQLRDFLKEASGIDISSLLGGFQEFTDAYGGFVLKQAEIEAKKNKETDDIIDQLFRPIGPTREDMPGQFDAERRQKIAERDKQTIQKTASNKVTTKTIELTNELMEAERKLADLEAKKGTFSEADKGALVYKEHLFDIATLIRHIAGLKLPSSLLQTQSGIAGQDLVDRSRGEGLMAFETPQPIFDPKQKEEGRNLANDAETMYGAISSSMNALGVGTDTFVGSMITGFGTVLTIMEAIKAVNSILSIIPGFASGGIATGSFIAGERGAELITPLGGGMSRIYNNSDTNRILNQTNTLSQSPVNIYLSANVNPKYFKAQMENYNSMKQYTKV